MKRKGLFASLLKTMLWVSVIGYAIIGSVQISRQNIYTRHIEESMTQTACHQVAGAVNAYITRYEWNADVLSSDNDINTFASDMHKMPHLNYELFTQYKTIQSRIMQVVALDSNDLSVQILPRAQVVVSDGMYVFKPETPFDEMINSGKIIVNKWMVNDGHLYLVNSLRKLAAGSGLIVLDVSEGSLFENAGMDGVDTFDYYLVNPEGQILSSSLRDLVGMELGDDLQEYLYCDEVMLAGRNMYLSKAIPGQNSGLRLLIVYDTTMLINGKQNSIIGTILMITVILTVSMLLFFRRGRVFRDGIIYIENLLSRIKGGEFFFEPKLRTADELQSIDEAICDMGRNVGWLNRSLVEAERLRKDSETRFLQMQINRHFLYNSLSSIRWMAVKNGQEDIAELMECLIRYYKVSLSYDDVITLEDDLKLLNDYVQLENVIHVGDLHLHIDVAEDLRGLKICKMTLQPFVENAIHHGKIQRKPLDIWVSAENIAGMVIIRIEDNGNGMTGECAQAISDVVNGLVPPSSSVGIYNTVTRLKKLYGDSVEIQLSSLQGTVVEIILPVNDIGI